MSTKKQRIGQPIAIPAGPPFCQAKEKFVKSRRGPR